MTCAGLGHITNTQWPDSCVYCGTEVAPPAPPWDWTSARQAVIVAAAERARRQRQARVQRAAAIATARRLGWSAGAAEDAIVRLIVSTAGFEDAMARLAVALRAVRAG